MSICLLIATFAVVMFVVWCRDRRCERINKWARNAVCRRVMRWHLSHHRIYSIILAIHGPEFSARSW